MTRWLIIAVIAVLAVVVFGAEALPYLVLGVLLGLSPLIIRRAGARIDPKVAAAVVAGLAVLVLAGVVFFAGDGQLPFVSLVQIDVVYEGEATFEEDPDGMKVAETVTIPNSAVSAAADSEFGDPIYSPKGAGSNAERQRLLFDDVASSLGGENWNLVERGTDDASFQRTRTVPVEVRAVPLETSNEIPLTSFRFQSSSEEGTTIELQPSGESKMRLTAGKYVLGHTFPEGERAEHVVADVEEVEVPLPDAGDPVEFEIRSPLARSELTAGLADLSLVGVGKWVLLFATGMVTAAVSGIGQDAVKNTLKRWWSRRRTPADESKDVS
jgi:hypothetical protein